MQRLAYSSSHFGTVVSVSIQAHFLHLYHCGIMAKCLEIVLPGVKSRNSAKLSRVFSMRL